MNPQSSTVCKPSLTADARRAARLSEWELITDLTLRDYFAAAALQGMNASPELMQFVTSGCRDLPFEKMAKKAYEQADAMLKARRETDGSP